MEAVKTIIIVLFLWEAAIYSAFSQDYRFVREVKQGEPALERSIRKWRWRERDSRQLHCYEMQYTGHGITAANLRDLSFLDSQIFKGDHHGHPSAITYVEETGRLVGMPRNYSEGRRGYLQLMEGYKKILEKGNGGFLFCLPRMRVPCWFYFVLDKEGNLYGIDIPLPPDKETRIWDHEELLSARDWDGENADMREVVNPYYPEFELDLSCYGERELYDLLTARFGDRRVEIRRGSEREWILLRAVWQASVKKEPGVSAKLQLTYVINNVGAVKVTQKMTVDKGAEVSNMFRFGMQMPMPRSFETVEYYGRGPIENYADRNHCTDLGIYRQSVDEQFYPYIRPQETGTKTDIRWWNMLDAGGNGLRIVAEAPFSASALHYTIESLDEGLYKKQGHSTTEVEQADFTNVCIDKKQAGLGCEDSWGRIARPEYQVPYADYEFTFIMTPVKHGLDL